MEKRNVSITLEKAREWYKQGGELKEIALQAFSEQELDQKAPGDWGVFVENKGISGYYVAENSDILQCVITFNHLSDRNVWPSKELAEASLALCQLSQLYEAWKEAGKEAGEWGIVKSCDSLKTWQGGLFKFKSGSDTGRFLVTFKDLFEIAKPLIA